MKGVCDAHRRIFRDVLDGPIVGRVKAEQNVIVDVATGRERFLPTPPERTAAELTALFDWVREHEFALAPPVLAGVFFAEFQAIHPFVNGNGRLGRYYNLALLTKLGLANAALVPLDTRFFRSQDKYYEMLASTNSGKDYHLWLRYFVGELKEAYELAVARADLKPALERFTRPSTRAVLEWVLTGDGGWFSHGNYPNPKRYSEPAISASLKELCEADILEPKGDRKGRRYRLRAQFLTEIYNRSL
ncbi:MAG: Fic family protein [Methanobacteriota archaeon]